MALLTALRPCPRAQRTRERIVLRPRPFARSHRPAHTLQHRVRLRRQRLLGQRRVDLLRLPSGERDALPRLPISAVRPAHVDRHPRRPPRLLPRHQYPDLREVPLLVHPELPAPNIGRVVHLQHHVRQVVRVHLHRALRHPRPCRVQVQHLVGLHDPALAPRRVALHQVHRAEGLDRRAAHQGDPAGNPGQTPGRLLVVSGDGLADPGGLGAPVPHFEAGLEGVELARGQGDRLAAGQVRGTPARGQGVRRRVRHTGGLRHGDHRCRGRGRGHGRVLATIRRRSTFGILGHAR